MMNWGMMGSGESYGTGGIDPFGAIFWLVILIDLILVGVWLWKQINKK